MNLADAIKASPYSTAIQEIGPYTYTVRQCDVEEGLGPDAFEETFQDGAMPVNNDADQYVTLDDLILGIGSRADDGWIPIGENGEPID